MSILKKSILSSFILVSFAIFFPILFEKDYKNNADWNIPIQFFVLWFLATILILTINSINKKIKS